MNTKTSVRDLCIYLLGWDTYAQVLTYLLELIMW